jgi:hypothetical protein
MVSHPISEKLPASLISRYNTFIPISVRQVLLLHIDRTIKTTFLLDILQHRRKSDTSFLKRSIKCFSQKSISLAI